MRRFKDCRLESNQLSAFVYPLAVGLRSRPAVACNRSRLGNRLLCVISALFLFGAQAWGQDPVQLVPKGQYDSIKVTRLVPVLEDRISFKSFPFSLEAPANAIRPSWNVPVGITWTAKGRTLTVTAGPKGEVTVTAEWSVIDFANQTITDQSGILIFQIGDVPQPLPPIPPTPPVPPPPPVPPAPVPVTSFRVILVYESGDTLTGPQNSVIYGKTVESFLNATCTGGKSGWRRRDKDVPGENDPDMAAIWSAAKSEFAAPKNTKTPAVVVQVNSKIEIIPVADTPAEMVAILKRYSEGR